MRRPPDNAKRPPAWDRRPLEDSSLRSDTASIPHAGICVRGDCRGQNCPMPCAIARLEARVTVIETFAAAINEVTR